MAAPSRRPPKGQSGPAARPARRDAAVPLDPVALLDAPLGKSGIPGAAVVGRVGARLGLRTVRDLLFHLPRRYDDLRELATLDTLRWRPDGDRISARVHVDDLRVEASFRRRVQRTTARFDDGTGSIEAVWFGRRFIERRLHVGDRVVVSGRLRRFGGRMTLDDPEFQPDDGSALLHAGRIVPVYRLTDGLTAQTLRRAVRGALDRCAASYPEYLDPEVRFEHGLAPIAAALEEAHFPTEFERRDAALARLAFDELLALQVGMVARRRLRTTQHGRSVVLDDPGDLRIRDAIVAGLRASVRLENLTLTDDQAAAIDAIRADLARPAPMLRLLQGDVGSGKTAVAAWALAAVAASGRQAVLLAPTDLLARQHQRTIAGLLEPIGIGVELVTGSRTAAETRRTRAGLAGGEARIAVGTHALFSQGVAYDDLGLVVIDEQHRFGVDQRAALEAKAGDPPHVLLMTATPIPRTLGQVLYADLEVSDLRMRPSGRPPVVTGIKTPAELDGTWTRVAEESKAGNRSFVVVPRIDRPVDEEIGLGLDEPEEDVVAEAASAEAEAERLRARLPDVRIGLVHGRMKATERDAEMARFRDGDLSVLVGTTVVEVGVDVPEATLMIVEDAERFGLAQLHQLRGRVGRGTVQSYCVLVSRAAPSEEAWKQLVKGETDTTSTEQARLVAVARTRDGFDLAEQDWKLRREGNVLGLVQSGLPRLRLASLQRDDHQALAIAARAHAERLVDARGALRPGASALAAEIERGWLARVATGDPGGAA